MCPYVALPVWIGHCFLCPPTCFFLWSVSVCDIFLDFGRHRLAHEHWVILTVVSPISYESRSGSLCVLVDTCPLPPLNPPSSSPAHLLAALIGALASSLSVSSSSTFPLLSSLASLTSPFPVLSHPPHISPSPSRSHPLTLCPPSLVPSTTM
jgi:hypothetical protein